MTFRIFDTDPESAPKSRQSFADDLVGRFRSGYMNGRRPVALEKWRVTTGDPEVAEAVHKILGGDEPKEWDAKGEDRIEVFTDAETVEILIERPEHLRTEMVLWSMQGKPIRRCDGVEQHGENAEGAPCVCPRSFDERKTAAKNGTGCQPSISLLFRLAEDPDLGLFRFTSGSWSMVRDLVRDQTEEKLRKIHEDNGGAPIVAELALELVKFETKDGQKRQYIKPIIKLIGAAEVDEAEDDGEPPF